MVTFLHHLRATMVRTGRMTNLASPAAAIGPIFAAVLIGGLATGQAHAQNECGTIVNGASSATIVCNGIAGDAGSDGSVNVVNASDTGDNTAGLTDADGLVIDFDTLTGGPLADLEFLTLELDGETAPLAIGNPTLNPSIGATNESLASLSDLTIRTLGEVTILGGRMGVVGGFYRGSGDVTVLTSEHTRIDISDPGSNGDGIFILRDDAGAATGDTTVLNSGTIRSESTFAAENITLENFENNGDIYLTTTDTSILETFSSGNQDPSLISNVYTRQRPSDISAGGDIFVDLAGTITAADAPVARGVWSDMFGGGETIINSSATITTSARESEAIYAIVDAPDNIHGVTINVSDGIITTTGASSSGVYGSVDSDISTAASSVTIDGGSVLSSGNGSYGVFSRSVGGSSEIVIDTSVTGGSGAGGGVFGGAATTGVSMIDIGANGVISAFSESAVVAAGGEATVTNDGTIFGNVFLTDLDDTFTNNSSTSWNMRNFADTDGDLIRDTEAVAVSDFGGGADTFTNTASGAVRLLTVEDMAGNNPNFDDAGQYLPPSARSIEVVGVEQAQIFNLEQFQHMGDLVLQDTQAGNAAPVAGDVLVISGAGVAGANGGGVYEPMGGRLLLDSVLDEGGAGSLSDVLVLDNVAVSNDPTEVRIINADPGQGAMTDTNGNGEVDLGEGILVIEVLGDSPASAFEMMPLVDNEFMYQLLQDPDGNWVLWSQDVMSLPTVVPVPTLNRFGLVLLIALLGIVAVTGRRGHW